MGLLGAIKKANFELLRSICACWQFREHTKKCWQNIMTSDDGFLEDKRRPRIGSQPHMKLIEYFVVAIKNLSTLWWHRSLKSNPSFIAKKSVDISVSIVHSCFVFYSIHSWIVLIDWNSFMTLLACLNLNLRFAVIIVCRNSLLQFFNIIRYEDDNRKDNNSMSCLVQINQCSLLLRN